jgi:hypothetical protein
MNSNSSDGQIHSSIIDPCFICEVVIAVASVDTKMRPGIYSTDAVGSRSAGSDAKGSEEGYHSTTSCTRLLVCLEISPTGLSRRFLDHFLVNQRNTCRLHETRCCACCILAAFAIPRFSFHRLERFYLHHEIGNSMSKGILESGQVLTSKLIHS